MLRSKGQVSAELTLLLLISVVVLGIAVAAASAMAGAFSEGLMKRKLDYDRSNLLSYAKDVCLSGSGSSRELQLLSKVESQNFSIPCEIDAEFPLQGKVVVKNRDGVVEIT